MGWIAAKDISEYQGSWQDTGEPIVLVKMSGGDAGLYYDRQATTNYYGAKNAGKAVGMYHFAGGTDPVKEAGYFLSACSPLDEGDVLALDWEVSHPNPVAWCRDFAGEIHVKTGIWPLLYINLATLNAYDWSPVLATCGLWLADWAVSPDAAIPTPHVYVMQQYADGPTYDRDAFFGTLDEFKAYGYHAPQPTPTPAPAPAPAEPPQPSVGTTPAPAHGEAPPPPTAPETPIATIPAKKPVVAPATCATRLPFWAGLLALIKRYMPWTKK